MCLLRRLATTRAKHAAQVAYQDRLELLRTRAPGVCGRGGYLGRRGRRIAVRPSTVGGVRRGRSCPRRRVAYQGRNAWQPRNRLGKGIAGSRPRLNDKIRGMESHGLTCRTLIWHLLPTGTPRTWGEIS